jgi:TonB-linked SusC/RagA family outer membrane protein
MKRKIALLLFALLTGLVTGLYAQGLQVTGKVTSKATGEALANATVAIRGTNQATTTDEAGNFTINIPQGTNRVLVITYAGMAAREITVTGSGTLNVALDLQASVLNEVVVVGYGTQSRQRVTSAISSVKAEELSTVSSTRIEQALQGRTPGVTILSNSGSPGAHQRIRIRGIGSNGSADPLYIVDGVRTGGIDNLDPSEVASIEVLKDAASAAIYGSAAANGVILITTKTGRRNTAEISYSGQYGNQSAGNVPKMMNARQYYQYMAESRTPNSPTLAELNAVQGDGTNWTDALFVNAPMQRHSINFSTGTERSTFLMSGSYFSQEGIIGGSKSHFDRYTFRINSDTRIKPWLNIGERLSYANIQRSGIGENNEFGSIVGSAIVLDPLTPVTYTGALPAHVLTALGQTTPGGLPISKLLRKDANGNYYGISNFVKGEYGNPLARVELTNNDLTQHKVEGNFFVDIEPLTGLKVTSRFGIDGAFQKEHSWSPTFWYSSESLNTAAGGSDYQNNWFNWQWENFATYNRRFNDHNFSLLAGTSANKSMWNYVGGSYSGLFKEELLFSYADAVPDLMDRIGSNRNFTTLLSFFGRLTYDYKNKLLLNASLRRDASSVFAEGHQWGTFPAVSLGYVLSNESFFTSAMGGKMNYLKLRASWGQNGSTQNVGIGAWQALIGATNPGYPGNNPDGTTAWFIGAAPGSLPNPELTWETSEQIDLGADMTFLNNRLRFTVDYYVKTTKDFLMPGGPATPVFVGNQMGVINSGEVQNKGWEFDLGYGNKPANARGFKYDISANLSTLKNEVTKMNEFVFEMGGAGVGTGWNASVFKLGYPVWSFRGYQTDGIFQSAEDIAAYKAKTGITGYNPNPGDPIVVDVNGDKLISSADQTIIGNPHPELLFGGRANVGYKGFDLLVFAQGTSGNDILMGFNRTDRPNANRPEFFYTNRWTGPGSTNSWFASNTISEHIYNGDMMVFDGSYVRLKQLQLGYTLPESVSNRIRVRNARFYVSLDDYFTFTKYPGFDPEGGSGGNNSIGIDRGVYPLSRKAMMGLSFNF